MNNDKKPYLHLRENGTTVDVYVHEGKCVTFFVLGDGYDDLNPKTITRWIDHYQRKTWVTQDFLDQMWSLAHRNLLPQ